MREEFEKVSINPHKWGTTAKAGLAVSLAFSIVSLSMTTISAMQRRVSLACETTAVTSTAVNSAPRSSQVVSQSPLLRMIVPGQIILDKCYSTSKVVFRPA